MIKAQRGKSKQVKKCTHVDTQQKECEKGGELVEDDRSTVSLALFHFRQVLARTKTTALPRARSTSSPIGGS